MKIDRLQVNHLTRPLGFDLSSTSLSYHFSGSEGTRQAATRIVVATNQELQNPVEDTGWQADISPLGYRLQTRLAPRTRYYWQVSVKNDLDQTFTSGIDWFETGKMTESWSGQWITCQSTTDRHPIFTKKFNCQQTVTKARLYICGLGLYVPCLNHHRVDNEYLAPGTHDYAAWLQYQTYDVTDQLQGENQLAVLLGNGWYRGRFGLNAPAVDPKKQAPWSLIAELHVTYADGSQEVINSDESWAVGRSTITSSGIYDGERRDDTLQPVELTPAQLDQSQHAPLHDRLSLPVKIHEKLPVKRIIHTAKGETVLDLGQNFAGTFQITVDRPAESILYLQFGEHLQDGGFFRGNLRSAKQEFSYVSDGKPHTIRPQFTYYGYRYVKVTGWENITKDDFVGLALYSDLTPAGQLGTGNKNINQLVHNARWGMHSNFIDTPTDCPQRDERLGWTGDAQVFCPTATYFADTAAFYKKYLFDMRTEQEKGDGRIVNVIPDYIKDKQSAAVWGDVATIIPWTLYKFYGDRNILRDNFFLMRDWVDYITKVDGNDHGWERVFQWGDWLALDNPRHDPNEVFGGTDAGFIADVYYFNSAMIVSQAANLLSNTKLADRYQELASRVRQRIEDEFFAPNGRPCIATQTGLLLALKYQLSKNPDQVRAMLRKAFSDNCDHLQTGFTGTPLLGDVLTQNKMTDLVYKLLLNTDFPSWLYAVKMGATTIWERWNSVNPDGKIETSMSSLNHYSYGSIVEWLFRYAAGLHQDPNHIGFTNLAFAPHPDKSLRFVTASYHGAGGDWHISWQIIDNHHLNIKLTVPFNCQATIKLPYLADQEAPLANKIFANFNDHTCHLSAGHYDVTYTSDRPLLYVFNTNCKIKDLFANQKVKDCLLTSLPQLSRLPKDVFDQPLRPFLLQYGGPLGIDKADLDKVDQQLQALK